MTSWRQMKLFWSIAILAGATCLFLLSSTTNLQAQGGAQPTPTDIGDGGGGSGSGGGGDEDDEATPQPPGAAVSGYVYNYSTGDREGGVKVVIEGDGWQVETVTDTNGYYYVGDLGFGRGVINLRLPPGAQPIVFDVPVWLVSGTSTEVDLGFYWGDKPPLPVLVSSKLEENLLTITIENRTSEPATGGVVEIETPASIRVSPIVNASQGQVIDHDSHQFRFDVGDLAAGDTATIQALLSDVPSLIQANQTVPNLLISFNYDQQLTPQLIETNPEPFIASLELPPAAASGTKGSVSAGRASAASQPASSSFVPATPQPEATPQAQLPVTGQRAVSPQAVTLTVSILLILGLALAGGWSLAAKR